MSSEYYDNDASQGSQSSAPEKGLQIWSCVTCRRRKVRCDRTDPCNHCTKHGIECHFPVTGRLPRRRGDKESQRSPFEKQTELLGRLRRLEAVVTELAIQVQEGPEKASESSGDQSRGQGSESTEGNATFDVNGFTSFMGGEDVSLESSELNEDFGNLVVNQDGSMQIGRGFWTVFCDEVDNIFQTLHEAIDDQMQPQQHPENTRPEVPESMRGVHQSFLLGNSLPVTAVDTLSPLPSQLFFLWQTYTDSVDPFIKVLHMPTVDAMVRSIRGKVSSLPQDQQALVFAMALAAVTSMSDDDVKESLNVDRPTLLARYRLGTEQALARAEFLTSSSLLVIQAVVIYVSVLPHLGASQLAWSMCGLLQRRLLALGFHRHLKDLPGNAGSNTSEVERQVKHLIWWQTRFTDSQCRDPRAPEILVEGEDDMDCVLGAIADAPGEYMTAGNCVLPRDMILCLVRVEIWRLKQSLRKSRDKSTGSLLGIINKARAKIDSCCIQNLDVEAPLESFILAMFNLFFARLEIGILQQQLRRQSDTETQDAEFRLSVTVLDIVYAMNKKSEWQTWKWQSQGHTPWDALRVVLHQICSRPWTALLDAGLSSANNFMTELAASSRQDPKYEAMSVLWQQAQAMAHRPSQAMPVDAVEPSQLMANLSTQSNGIASEQLGAYPSPKELEIDAAGLWQNGTSSMNGVDDMDLDAFLLEDFSWDLLQPSFLYDFAMEGNGQT